VFTCFIRYELAPGQRAEFQAYAQSWIALINKFGGTHHGYFLPPGASDVVPDPSFSFPGLGRNGPPDIAVALFSFPDIESYDAYRRDVATDPECIAATERFNASPCFSGYERNFLVPVFA
jgi:hypothetical protein